jgi:hypothetical protein
LTEVKLRTQEQLAASRYLQEQSLQGIEELTVENKKI